MAKSAVKVETVALGRLFLWPENPRHDPVTMEADAIHQLCEKEQVAQLAKDIVAVGLNPLERVAFVPVADSALTKSKSSYYIVDGNRRLCALKLLQDPELAPANLKTQFEKLAKEWGPIQELEGVVFATEEEARVWLKRIHTGAQDGIGRRSWTTEQQARFDGENKNKDAQFLLDYAEKRGLISIDERNRKITTVQRFLGNETFREALGIDKDPAKQGLQQTRPDDDLVELTGSFMRDLVGGKTVNSRMNSDEIKKYARALLSSKKISGQRIEAKPLKITGSGTRKGKLNRKPSKPDKAKTVGFENDIQAALKTLGNEKLKSLYYSITQIELEDHTPLVSVGAWSFFETLTLCAGRNDGTKFNAYLSAQKVQGYGVTERAGPIADALRRINEFGNSTKHHKLAGTFNGQQPHNDFAVLKNVMLGCIREATNKL
jgi:hypothetical protein